MNILVELTKILNENGVHYTMDKLTGWMEYIEMHDLDVAQWFEMTKKNCPEEFEYEENVCPYDCSLNITELAEKVADAIGVKSTPAFEANLFDTIFDTFNENGEDFIELNILGVEMSIQSNILWADTDKDLKFSFYQN